MNSCGFYRNMASITKGDGTEWNMTPVQAYLIIEVCTFLNQGFVILNKKPRQRKVRNRIDFFHSMQRILSYSIDWAWFNSGLVLIDGGEYILRLKEI